MITNESAKGMTDAELLYARGDLDKTIKIQEQGVQEGMNCPKLGQYRDEWYAVLGEIDRRRLAATKEMTLKVGHGAEVVALVAVLRMVTSNASLIQPEYAQAARTLLDKVLAAVRVQGC